MKHEPITEEFINILNCDENLKKLVQKSLKQGAIINPDKLTNPAQSLDELYTFLDWASKCMPWEVLKNLPYSSLYSKIDQATGYFWFIFDQPLKELENKGYYYPTLQYHEPIASWIKNFSKTWGNFLSTKESWNNKYYELAKQDNKFGLNNGWYEEKNVWTSFNDFFSRKLVSTTSRSIDSTTVIAPADSTPQGIYRINENNELLNFDKNIKSAKFTSIVDLIGKDSKYCNSFKNGTLTHTFLDINDYHRYHFPIDGKIVEMRKISGANAGGGITEWDNINKRYVYYNEMGFQMIETRDCIILETEKYGLVAILPVGMSQICSCNFEADLKVGQTVKKGDPLGYFLFGGSNIVMIFQECVECECLLEKSGNNYNHILMGQQYFNLINKVNCIQ